MKIIYIVILTFILMIASAGCLHQDSAYDNVNLGVLSPQDYHTDKHHSYPQNEIDGVDWNMGDGFGRDQ